MKNFNTKIDDNLDLQLNLYAIHLGSTKAKAGARAMTQGIPQWVMAMPPSEARQMAAEVAAEPATGEDSSDNEDPLEKLGAE